ncbi:ATP-grasp domain-containing protein [Micromonospora sp. WMMD734]|uniref:ATP-grasp domain-containing protein n=1 Tax=Micromonospora sp. WMMD734 TaxID=3404129 RepID=UPI003B95D03D
MPKHVLVVGGVDFMIDKVEKLGLRYSMVQLPELVSDRHLQGARRFAVIDYRDSDEVLAVARAWHSIDPFDAVVSFTEYGLEPASRCARELGVAGDNLDAVLLTRDKKKTRDLLERHGLSPVRHRICASPADAATFLGELDGRPMVLKPSDRGLSEGVVVVGPTEALADGWAWAAAATTGPILAEEYLDGPEYSVESFSLAGQHDIVMITEKVTTELPRFIEVGHQAPARLAPAVREQVVELVTALLTLIGQRTGPAHTEIRLTAAGPRVIESQTRAGGDQIWEMCELVTGVDLLSETMIALLGLPMPRRVPAAKAAAIRFFSFENGRVAGVHGLAEAAADEGVVRLVCTLRPGQELGLLESSTSRQGYALCVGDSTDDAVAHAEATHDRVAVEWEPVTPDS